MNNGAFQEDPNLQMAESSAPIHIRPRRALNPGRSRRDDFHRAPSLKLFHHGQPQQPSEELSLSGSVIKGDLPLANQQHKEELTSLDDTTIPSTSSSSHTRPDLQTKCASLEFSVNILQGEGLAACDTNIFGRETSSDPYIIVGILPGEDQDPVYVGQTKHHLATLNPKWNTRITKVLPTSIFTNDSYTVELKIMDYDLIGEDICMGVVRIPMTLDTVSKNSEWYQIPKESAKKACGRIQLAIDTKKVYTMANFLDHSHRRRSSRMLGFTSPTPEPPEPEDFILDLSPVSTTPKKKTKAKLSASKMIGAGSKMATSAIGAGTKVVGHNVKKASHATTAAANKMVGVLAAPTKSLLRRKSPGSMSVTSMSMDGASISSKLGSYYTNLDGDGEDKELMVLVTLHQGDGLAAKEWNTFGQKISSDAYAFLEVWPKGVPPNDEDAAAAVYPNMTFGRSLTVQNTRTPVWNYTFEPFYVPLHMLDKEKAVLRLCIMDDGFGLAEDDSIGSIDISLHPEKNLVIKEKWYSVSNVSAARATGKIQLSLQTSKTIKVPEREDPSSSLVETAQSILKEPVQTEERDMNLLIPDAYKLRDEESTTSIPAALTTVDRGRHSNLHKGRLRKISSNPEIHERLQPSRTRGGDRRSRKNELLRALEDKSSLSILDRRNANRASRSKILKETTKGAADSVPKSPPRSHSVDAASALKPGVESVDKEEIQKESGSSQKKDHRRESDKKRKSSRKGMEDSSGRLNNSGSMSISSSRVSSRRLNGSMSMSSSRISSRRLNESMDMSSSRASSRRLHGSVSMSTSLNSSRLLNESIDMSTSRMSLSSRRNSSRNHESMSMLSSSRSDRERGAARRLSNASQRGTRRLMVDESTSSSSVPPVENQDERRRSGSSKSRRSSRRPSSRETKRTKNTKGPPPTRGLRNSKTTRSSTVEVGRGSSVSSDSRIRGEDRPVRSPAHDNITTTGEGEGSSKLKSQSRRSRSASDTRQHRRGEDRAVDIPSSRRRESGGKSKSRSSSSAAATARRMSASEGRNRGEERPVDVPRRRESDGKSKSRPSRRMSSASDSRPGSEEKPSRRMSSASESQSRTREEERPTLRRPSLID